MEKQKYSAVDSLLKGLQDDDPYKVLTLSDEVMGITSLAPFETRQGRKAFHRCFGSDKFPIGVWRFNVGGSVSDHVVVFRILNGVDTETNPAVAAAIAEASIDAPYLLTRKETLNDIKIIRSAAKASTGKARAQSILMNILPLNVKSAFVSKTKEKDELVSELALLIASADINTDEEELELLEDLRYLNGANENPLFQAYWDSMAKVVELDGSGAERRRHAEGEGIEATTKICYAPGLNSLEQLHKATLNHLKCVENKIEGTDFAVPSNEWCRRQLSPYRETSMTAETFTGRLPIKRVLQAKNLRSFHAHAHYVAQMKKIWRYHVSKLRCMFEDCEIEIGYQVDIMPWYQCIMALGQDDKANIPVAIHGPIAATAHNKARAFVENGTQVHASDHDWSFLKIAPSVTSMLNIGREPGESLFSGGQNGQGEITVSLHDSTFHPSTSRHHAASMIGYLREKAGTVAKETQAASLSEDIDVDAIPDSAESFLSDDLIASFMPYVVLLETDGGPDHNLKFLRNCISLLATFLVGNMDKLVAVRGCPGHSYLNTVERCMSILNLGLTNLGVRVDFDSPDWLFDLLEGNGSMKKLREAIALYDSDLQQAIIQREKMESQKRMWEEINQLEDNEMEEEEMTEEEEGVYPKGYMTNTFFDTWGWYEGEVTSNEGMHLLLSKYIFI